MSEEQQSGTESDQSGKAAEFKPITTQDDFEKALGKRLERERAKFADYDDVKTKAQEFDKLQEQSKTDLQKAQERAEAAEKKAAQAERTALKTRIAAEMNVPIEVLHGDDEPTIRAAADRVIAWRDSNKPQPPSARKLKSGSTGSDAGPLDGKERAAAALRQMRGGNH